MCIRDSLHADEAPDEELTPSEYCNQKECGRPPTAFQRRSDAADLGEFPPYPESWPSRSQWCPRTQHRE